MTLSRLVLSSAAFAVVMAPLFYVQEAHAACASNDPQCSFGRAPDLQADYTQDLNQPAVGFQWAQNFGASMGVSIGAGLYMTKKDDEPMFSVDMSAGEGPPVEAYWTDTKQITLKFLDTTAKNAKLRSRYGLKAQIQFHAEALGNNYDKSWDVTQLLTSLGRSDFDFDAQQTLEFAPWAFAAPVSVGVAAGSIDTTNLFDVPLSSIGMPTNWVSGAFGVFISTEGTSVQYQTLGAKFDGVASVPGQDYVLPTKAEYGDALSVRLAVQGGITVQGSLYAKPYIELSSIGNCNSSNTCGYPGWPIRFSANSLSIHEEFRIPAEERASLPLEFQETTVTIPIPNVKAEKTALSMSGRSGKVTISNTGTKVARLKLSVDNTAFQITGGPEQEIAAGGTLDLAISYGANDQGTGQLIVITNDPDTPQLTINLGANGASVREPNQDDPDPNNSNGGRGGGGIAADEDDESGCGCHTAGSTGSQAGMALLIAGVAIVLRRRRR